MNLINLKMATALTAVLTMLVTLAPDSANAQVSRRFRADGSSNRSNAGMFSFELDTSATRGADGNYIGAIRDFTEIPFDGGTPLFRSSADLRVSRFDIPTDRMQEIPGFNFTTNQLTTDLGFEGTEYPTFEDLIARFPTLSNGGLRYDINLSNSITATFLIPSTDELGLSGSLPGADEFFNTRGNIAGVIDRFNEALELGSNPDQVFLSTIINVSNPTSVPEPNATTGMLTLGALGALSLLKRKKRSGNII